MSRTIGERLDELKKILEEGKILYHEGLGNEVDFHIFDYDPEDEFIVRDAIENVFLTDNLKLKDDYIIKRFDIYNIILEILKENKLIDTLIKNEEKKGTSKIYQDIQEIIGIGTSDNLIINKLQYEIGDKEIIFITGVAKCFGIIRGHEILNSLQPIVTNNPLIMFYPGTYDGHSMTLFNQIEPDSYYRAFQIVSR